MFRHLKPLIERYPYLALVYRTIRDTWNVDHQKPKATRYGFTLIGNAAMQDGTFEPEETAIVMNNLLKADVFIDVGANVGYYTCLARSFGKHTIAVEPLAQNLNYLYANLNENDWNDIEVWPVALSSKPGIATLYGASTGASLISGWAGASSLMRGSIALSTLDILCTRFVGKRLLIKIDVEGAEYAVLKGAYHTLNMLPRPIWLVEISFSEHHPAGLNPDFAKTFELFWQNGYEAFTADQESRLVSKTDVDLWVSNQRRSLDCINYIFKDRS